MEPEGMAITTQRGRLVEELVQEHQSMVRGFLAYLGCPAALLDDLVQEVFLSVLASPFEVRGPRQTAAFLRKVAHHLLLKAVQRERRQPRSLEPAAAEAAWLAFEGEDGGSGYLAALRECLRGLRGRPADVIHLRYHEGLQREAIGRRLGLSESGVKSILSRTRARLRDCVERRLPA